MTNNSHKLPPTASSTDSIIAEICASHTVQLQEAFQTLLTELRTRADSDIISIIWQTDDVRIQRPDLDTEQCREVLERLERHHDANIGINWDVIDWVAHDCYPEPDNLAELREFAIID